MFVRQVLALLAGLGVTVLVVVLGTIIATVMMIHGTDPQHITAPPQYVAANLVISALGAVLGGVTVARITSGRSFYTVVLLAVVLFTSGIVPVIRGTPPASGQPDWYPLTLALLAPAGVLLGGFLERRRISERIPS